MAKKKAQTRAVKTHALDTPKYLDIHGKEKGVHYRYVKRNEGDIGRRKMQGFEISDNPKLVGPRHDGGTTLGTHDLILMQTSMENRDAIRKIGTDRARRNIEGTLADSADLQDSTTISKETLPAGSETDTIFE